MRTVLIGKIAFHYKPMCTFGLSTRVAKTHASNMRKVFVKPAPHGIREFLDLVMQLVSLHELDPNLYSLAASSSVMSRTTIEALTQRILDVMVSTVPKLKRPVNINVNSC